ncbi:Zinc finger, GRF-type [Sesbania bispinosa]|nr:Zinc finger, GRF-type [Sesbania bispinosa]KAJ1414320.1 Zinc finger, GRF-type [Sesbania bispinosa]KAJ1417615.1 Zinc finger, GRF-type [Sesbania bispinosa]KAJ1418031.1 Zinc finger, GRF-type [Sesbania bispinosa]
MGGDYKNPKPKPEKRSFNGGSSISSASMANAIRVCHCGRKAAIRTSNTQRNPGRAFYTCPLPKDDYLNCNYFAWIEDMGSAEFESDMDAWLKNQINFKLRMLGAEIRNIRIIVIVVGCLMAVMIMMQLILMLH